jgi:hypothetical protein
MLLLVFLAFSSFTAQILVGLSLGQSCCTSISVIAQIYWENLPRCLFHVHWSCVYHDFIPDSFACNEIICSSILMLIPSYFTSGFDVLWTELQSWPFCFPIYSSHHSLINDFIEETYWQVSFHWKIHALP